MTRINLLNQIQCQMNSPALEKTGPKTESFAAKWPHGTKARLEQFRVEHGLRSWSQAALELINRGLDDFPA